MNDKTDSTKSTPAPGTKTGWRHWHHKSRIILMLLAAVAIIVYLVRAGLAKQYEGLGAALCVISCGGFLIWHAIHLFAEQDAIDEKLMNQSNPAEKEINS